MDFHRTPRSFSDDPARLANLRVPDEFRLDAAQFDRVRATRRGLLTSASGLGLAALLSACGSSTDAGAASASGGASGSAAASSGPRLVKDERGQMIGLDHQPTRVSAVFDGVDVQNIIACGLKPISSGDTPGLQRPAPWVENQLDGVTYIPTTDGVNVEKIAAMKPELIISSYYDDKTYATLSAIAPLYMIPWRDEWRKQLTDIGRLLWRDEQAKQAAAKVDEAFAQGREKLAHRKGEQLAVISTFGGDASKVSISNRLDGIGLAIQGLGLAPLPAPEKPGMPFNWISSENLDQIKGDRLVIIDFDYDTSQPSPTTTKLLASPLGQKIPARRGGVVWMSKAATNASYLDTALSMPFLINELVEKLK